MDVKDQLLIAVAFIGWTVGLFQFFINRRNQKRDKLIDRRYEAYSAYMKKSDELMNGVRTDPGMIYGISSDFMKIALTGDEELVKNALIEYNEKLLDYVKRGTDPLLILKQELGQLMLICSNELNLKIEELKTLTTDFNNEMQNALNSISTNDTNSVVAGLEKIGNNERWLGFENLNKEIIQLMRKEIANK
jgi:hypothetical protein